MPHTNIGLRNQQAVERNGRKLIELWRKSDDPVLRGMSFSYQSLLNQQINLFNAANIVTNR